MTTFAIGLEYDGTHYHGWQIQENVPSIQAALNQALSAVADCSIKTHSAGRTDKGVHATGQVAHFVTDVERTTDAWLMGANTHLPDDIRVTWCCEVSDDFNSRFSAIARRYEYIIYNRHVKPCLNRHLVSWHYRELDIELMKTAAEYLIGEHDFNAYRAVVCQAKTPIREVQHIDIKRKNEIITLDIQANAFLHHMVRNIVGVLLEIGEGNREPEWAKEVLDSKDRTLGGITAKPHGLILAEVIYPEGLSPQLIPVDSQDRPP